MKIYLFVALLLPVIIIVISAIIVGSIPGCTVDEGVGASRACGAIGPLLANGILGGFLWLVFGLGSLFIVMPLVFIKAIFSKNNETK